MSLIKVSEATPESRSVYSPACDNQGNGIAIEPVHVSFDAIVLPGCIYQPGRDLVNSVNASGKWKSISAKHTSGFSTSTYIMKMYQHDFCNLEAVFVAYFDSFTHTFCGP